MVYRTENSRKINKPSVPGVRRIEIIHTSRILQEFNRILSNSSFSNPPSCRKDSRPTSAKSGTYTRTPMPRPCPGLHRHHFSSSVQPSERLSPSFSSPAYIKNQPSLPCRRVARSVIPEKCTDPPYIFASRRNGENVPVPQPKPPDRVSGPGHFPRLFYCSVNPGHEPWTSGTETFILFISSTRKIIAANPVSRGPAR